MTTPIVSISAKEKKLASTPESSASKAGAFPKIQGNAHQK